MQLNEQQQAAVEYLEGPLLVLAGPGTGKTQLLSQKVAYILKETDTNPENILCLTFTEIGAANMRERLKSLIGKAGAKVNIGTYHSFGQDILARYRNYAENYERKLDNVVDEVTQFKIVKKIRDGLNGSDILQGDNISDIIKVISDAKSAGLTAADLAMVAEQNMSDSKVLSEAVNLILEKMPARGSYPKTLEESYQPIYEILSSYKNAAPIVKNVERMIVDLARSLEFAIDEANETKKISPLSAWKKAYFEKDEAGKYRLKDRIANKKLASVAVVMERYQNYLREEGMFDFDDMIQEAIQALEQDKGFRLTLSEQYQYIMLDEFQDTNPSQFKVVKYLTDYEKPVVMAVGDDDQAIYEFQGALVTNLKDFQEHYGAKVIALKENYRSSQEILDFSTAIIKQAVDRFEPSKTLLSRNAKYASLTNSQIERREFLSSEAEFGYVAKRIAELVKSGVKQNEIAVISYKTKYFEPLLGFLKKYPEIRIAYDKRDNLLEDEKIAEILKVIKVALTLARGKNVREEIFSVLSGELFEVPVAEVVRISTTATKERRPIFEVLAESENEKAKAAVEFLSELVKVSDTQPIEKVLWQISERMRLEQLSEYEQFKFYENLASLEGKLKKHFGERVILMADLMEMVEDYQAANMMIATNSPYRDADEAVQIMTAHKAKGLEFEYVFMISVDNTAWGKGKGNNNFLSLPKNLTHIRHTGMTDGERLRILYVAMTRAKAHLILTNSQTDFSGNKKERLEYLEETTQKNEETGAEEIVSPFLPDKKVCTEYDGSINLNLENLKAWLKPYVESPDVRAIYKERVANYQLSASALISFVDINYAGPLEFFKRSLLGVPQEADSESILLGNLIHNVFEAVTNKEISDDEAIGLLEDKLETCTADDDVRRRLRDVGEMSVRTSLAKFGEILRNGKAEVNLSNEKITVEGVPLIGRLDHIIIDEEKKTLEVYDFKTSKYHADKWTAKPVLFKQMLQLGFYKLLLNNSPTYQKYEVTRGHILFVRPDKDGEVYDKVYEFNEADEQALIKLISAVYDQITTLKFLDDPELMVQPDKDCSIQDFIALILAKSGII